MSSVCVYRRPHMETVMKRILLTAALLGASATALMAAGPRADLDNDGQVTKTEFTAVALDAFTAADADADGFLTQDEGKALREARREERQDKRQGMIFDRLDTNGDGAISRTEMETTQAERDAKRRDRREAMRARLLERYDTNVDGELSEAERAVIRAERADRKDGREDRRSERRAERPTPDADGDGLISEAEHMAIVEQLFTRMDANGDGVLTQGEGRERKPKRGKWRNR